MLRQLTFQDASFLYQDSPQTPMHVGSVAILDPTKSPYGPLTLEGVTRFYRDRLHLMTTARRRLVNVPFGIDRPYWNEDENFDLEYHIREVGLPEPNERDADRRAGADAEFHRADVAGARVDVDRQ